MDLLRLIRHTGLGLAMLLLLAVGALFSPLHAQVSYDFTRVEYFFDADPGQGQGTTVPLPNNPGTTLSNLSFTASLAPLTPGFHSLFIRSRAATGFWSQTYRRILYKEAATSTAPPPNLAGAEYFIDADPGYGAGTAVSITGSSSNAAGVAFTVGLGSVTEGFHSLSVRSRDANGRWSQTYRQIFYVEPTTTTAPPARLAAVEYFVDTDPGYGQGTSAPITGGGTNATGVSFTVGLGALPVGFHTLFYRVRDVAGKWSQTQNRIFYVDDLTVATAPNINKAEYYFDTDPGYGAGVNVPIATPATNLTNLNLLADASGLSSGQHRLFVRTRDANGGWSQVLSRAFAKSGCNNSPNYAANQPTTSYTGNGITATAVEQMFNGAAVTGGSSTFFNNYYAQVDLGASTLRTVSEVQLALQNVNGTAVSYTLTTEASGNLNTWSTIDTYTATLPANQTTPTNIVRTLATVQNNVRGIRLRLTLPTLAQGIRLTNAGVYFFPTTCPVPVITNFTPATGPAGTVVTITGTDLGGATAVTFNGTPAGPITNNTSTGLTVAAPAGGTDGQICVTTAGGTACSGASYLYPATIATGTISPSSYCTGNTLTVPFSTNTSRFATGNTYNFQLSDASGVFAANAPLLGTLQSSNATGGVLTGSIPQATPAGSGYRVRVVASNPAVTGTDNGANLTIGTTPVSQATGPASVANGAPIALSVTPTYSGATYSWSGPGGFSSTLANPTTSTTTAGTARYFVTVTLGSCSSSSFVDVTVQPSTDPILTMSTFGGSLCLGASRTVSFAVSGNPYPAGNTITAQLSDASGSFVSSVNIGSTSFSGQGNGALTATIPASATAGTGYRIRVISSNPVITSNDNGSNLTLNALPTVTVSSNSPVAQGGTIILNGGPAVTGNSYVWTVAYTGGGSATVGTTQNLTLTNAQPSQSGNYTLTITNAAGCSASASTPVTVNAAAPVTTLTLNPLAGPLCAGTGYTLSYTAGGPSFNAGNTITAQLSDASGSFAAPVSIGSVNTTAATNGTLGVTIPASASGTGYRIRLQSSSPAITSNDNGSSLTITNLSTVSAGSNSPVASGNTITLTATGISGATYAWTGPNGYTSSGPNQNIGSATTANSGTYSVTVSLNGCSTTVSTTVVVNPPVVVASIQTSSLASGYCAGSALSVSFTANGFTAGNVFTAQLSNASGSFASPVAIGTLSGTASATIAAVIPAGTAPGAGYRIRVVGSQPATVGADNGADILIGAANAYTWLGAVNTSWSNAANWSCNAVPTAATNVTIPAGLSLYPVAGAGSTAQNLTIASGASLTLSGQFVLTGNLTNNGTFAPGTSAFVCGGTTAQTLGGSGTLRFYDLTINNAAGATLTSAAGVQHVLTLTAGNLASGNNLTLLSDASGTAMVVNPAGGGVVTGRATMERFIMGAGTAGYRHYSSPMQTGTATVQEFADDVPNFNVNPAYNTQGNTVTPFPTLFQYNEARLTVALPTFDQGWMVPAATDILTPGRGYSAQTAPGTVVDVSGTLASASVSYPLSRGPLAEAGWHLLGNPFPSPLDWDQVPAVAGINQALYVFVPSGPYSGTYRSYVGGIGQNGGTKDLAAMQGFFVRATSGAGATLTLPASARPSAYLNPGFNRTTTSTTHPLVRLQAQSASGPADETVLYFDPAATPAFDAALDAYKVQLNGNGAPSLWSVAGADGLSINALPSLAAGPSIPLGVRVGQAGSHTLEATELLNLPPGTEVWLEDRELGTRQNLTLTPTYAFTMSPSYTGQRFYLWLQASSVLGTATGGLQATTHLYPNPTTGAATLEMAGLTGTGAVQLEVLNALGQVLLKRSAQPRAGILREQLDLTGLATGVYSVRIFTAQGVLTRKLTLN
ncbi:T9SS type A sorting domain-containing protein [Hymenobacter sp. M29]|uniref:T9SS type A sorting domain-containing protein n=1 Tax=Hymenobacter mellowenesis TaxID=3063995 RepID=A0ABT9A5L3_9BACT|nr:T9SS type A sorting domain-containing protein [Hymenobacter sp. M29]MDO7845128.1 T9SS type A sorting domain-containing protein [Hymenobacter sp. M29]